MEDYYKELGRVEAQGFSAAPATGLESIIGDIRSSYTDPKRQKLPDQPEDFNPDNGLVFGTEIGGPEKLSFYEKNYNVQDAYATMRDGSVVKRYDDYKVGVDNAEYAAQTQSTADKWVNGLTKFAGQVGTGIIGGTVGTVNGIYEGVKQGSFRATYDNQFNNYIDDLNEKMDYKLPNYYTKEERDMGFFESMGTANFWAKDVLGGAAFTVSAIGSEAIWNYATGGAAAATSAARLGAKLERFAASGSRLQKGLSKMTAMAEARSLASKPVLQTYLNAKLPVGMATAFGKAGKLANVARFTYTSAGFESGMEARTYIRESKENFLEDFESKNNRKPTQQELDEFDKDLTNSANALYGYNMAIVGSSNLMTIGRIFDISSPLSAPSKWANSKIFGIGLENVDGKMIAKTATKFQKAAQYGFNLGESALIEGLWEEGMQSVGQNTAKNWIKSTYDPKYLNNTMQIGDAFTQGLSDTYGTKEGMKEVGIGMIIGLLTGTGISAYKNKSLRGNFVQEENRVKSLETFYDSNYSPNKMAQTIAYAGRSQAAGEGIDNARKTGDVTGGELSRQSSIIAQISHAHNLEYTDETVKQTEAAIKNIDNESIMKEYGVDEQGAEDLKQKMIDEYKSTTKTFTKNREFAEYYLNDNLTKEEKAKLDKVSMSAIKDAVAYELTLGEKVHGFSQDLLDSIKNEVGKTLGEEISTALSIEDTLLKAGKDTQRKAKNTEKKIVNLEKERVNLEREYKQLENTLSTISDLESRRNALNKIDGVRTRMAQLETEKEQLTTEYRLLIKTANLTNPFGKDVDELVITSTTLQNRENNLQRIKELIQEHKKIDPQQALKLQKLVSEYGKSIYAFKRYADLARQLSDPKLGLRGKRNIISEIYSDKSPNLMTAEFLQGVLDSMQERGVEEFINKIETAEPVKEVIEKAGQDAEETEAAQVGDSIKKPTREEKQAKRDEAIAKVTQEYDDKIAELTAQGQSALTDQEKEVSRLRAEEQKELLSAIPDASNYLTDGKVDKTKLTSPEDIAKFEEIYDKYDALISPLLKSKKGGNWLSSIINKAKENYTNWIRGEYNREPKESNLQLFDDILKNPTASGFNNILQQLYNGIRLAKYDRSNVEIGIEDYTSEPNSNIEEVRDEKGWHYRVPFGTSTEKSKLRISLNIKGSKELIDILDNIAKDYNIYYKTPTTSMEWLDRHDPVTIYISNTTLTDAQIQELKDRVVKETAPYIRGNEGFGLYGENIATGVEFGEEATEANANSLIAEALLIDKTLSEGVKKYLTGTNGKLKGSVGQQMAVRQLLDIVNQESETVAEPEQTSTVDNTKEIEKLEKEKQAKIDEINKRYQLESTNVAEVKTSIKDFIANLIKNSPYLMEYYGTETTPKMPSEAEMLEFQALAERAINDPKINNKTISFKSPYGNSTLPQLGKNLVSLSKEEVLRLQELNEKFANWRLLEAYGSKDGVSIAEMIMQDIARSQTVPVIPDVELTDVELQTAVDPNPTVTDEGEPIRNGEILQTYENVFVSQTKNGTSVSHLTLAGLLKRLALDTIRYEQVETKGNKEIVKSSKDNLSLTDLETLAKVGAKFTVVLEDGSSAVIRIDKGGRLLFKSKAEYQNIFSQASLQTNNIKLYNNGGYGVVYDLKTNKNLSTDFKDSNTYTPSQLYEMLPGEPVLFSVDLENEYNQMLIEGYQQGLQDIEDGVPNAKTEEELDKDLMDNLKINATDYRGNKLSDLKANYDISDSPGFLRVRLAALNAVKLALEGGVAVSGTNLELPIQTKVKHVFLGTPNFVYEDGKIKYFEIEPKKVVTYGYIQNGKLVLKDGKTTKVRKDYISKFLNKNGTPVVVMRQGQYLFAFPLNLKKTNNNIGDAFLNSMVDEFQKGDGKNLASLSLELNQMLVDNGFSTTKYDLHFLDMENQTLFDQEGNITRNLQQAIADLNKVEQTADVKEWMSQTYSAEDLVNDASIAVDMTDNPLSSPKPIIDLSPNGLTSSVKDWRINFTDEKASEILDKFINNTLTAKEYDFLDHPKVVALLRELVKVSPEYRAKVETIIDDLEDC
jgi:hypothetical protein